MKHNLLIFFTFCIAVTVPLRSQSIITIATDGKNAKSDRKMISAAADIQDILISGIKAGLKPVNLSFSRDSLGGIYSTFFNLYSRLRKDDLMVLLIAGPWNKINSNPELSSLDSNFPDKITLDYLFNFLYYLKSECAFVFVVPPPGTKLTGAESAVDWKNLNINGKYLIIIDSDINDVDDLVSAIDDTFSELSDQSEKMLEEKKLPLISDWVRLMASEGAKYGLKLLIYPVSAAANPYMRLKDE